MKKVLVFGGSGFLGFYLVKELLKREYNVTIADLSIGEGLEKVDFIKCNITKEEDVKNAFKSNDYDIVYNLAGFANLDDAVNNPVKTIELNVLANMFILKECTVNKISKFVYASSAYAMSNKGSFYGISKLASEKIIEEYHKRYDLQFVILRYGSVYSERKYHNNYIYKLVEEAVLNKKIEHQGDGKEVREYIHAADAAMLSVDVIESDKYSNLHVILTGSERMQREGLFNMINEMLGDTVEVSYKGEDSINHYKYTPYSFMPAVSKKLMPNPHIDLGQGLLACINSVNYRD